MERDHIDRAMGAAALRIERDPTFSGRMIVSIVIGDAERCCYVASVEADVAATLGFEAAGQHFDEPAQAMTWLQLRQHELSSSLHPPQVAA